jgi:hypothetical protein
MSEPTHRKQTDARAWVRGKSDYGGRRKGTSASVLLNMSGRFSLPEMIVQSNGELGISMWDVTNRRWRRTTVEMGKVK